MGPNGCGKSNVVDAIKWVMGEQSAQKLRGRGMEDVIFNGCETQGPAGFAEVALTFDNTDGLAPVEYRDYPEIEVARRLDREGRSDYFINKTPVRLLDVTNLFLGTGVGRRAYSIIEQGRIGLIVSAKAGDRRAMIEEAAGVTKYKIRKKAAERKMDATRQNLLRVSDILHELEKNLASLKRQAQKAERYRRYRDEIRELELYVASFKYLELFHSERALGASTAQASTHVDEARHQLEIKETDYETKRAGVESIRSEVENTQAKSYALDNEIKLLEGQSEREKQALDNAKEREEAADREIARIANELLELGHDVESHKSSLADLLSQAEAADETVTEQKAELERRRSAMEEIELTLNQTKTLVAEVSTRIARDEAVVNAFEKQHAAVEKRAATLSSRDEALREELESNHTELAALTARLDGLRGGGEQKQLLKSQIEESVKTLRRDIDVASAALNTVTEELARKRSRLASIKRVQQSFEGVGAGVRELMHNTALSESGAILGLVADHLRPLETSYTLPLASALGKTLQWVVTRDEATAIETARELRTTAAGSITLLPRDIGELQDKSRLQNAVATTSSEPPVYSSDSYPPPGPFRQMPEGVPRIWKRLSDCVDCVEADYGIRDYLLGAYVMVERFEDAITLRDHGYRGHIVTSDGVVLRNGTVNIANSHDGSSHLLEMQSEMHALTAEVERLEEQAVQKRAHHLALRQRFAETEAQVEAARSDAHASELSLVRADEERGRRAADKARIEETRKAIAAELEQVGQQTRALIDERDNALRDLEEAREALETASAKEQELEAVAEARRKAVEEQTARVTEFSIKLAQTSERVESDKAALARLEETVAGLNTRKGEIIEQRQAAVMLQEETAQKIVKTGEALELKVRAVFDAEQVLTAKRAAFDEAQAGLVKHEREIKDQRAALDELNKKQNVLAIEHREAVIGLGHLVDGVRERHRVELTEILGEYHARPLPDEATTDRVTELARLIERMGEINLTAIEEFEEKSKRYEYLKGQKNDLDEALLSLERAIKQMNRESRKLFKDAFIGINERFKKIFPQMFKGGKAELRLTDPNNLLETGVEILATPPGKRLGSLELMSGGEKALTAVALIFSMFQYKPSPFCILDEVDAPLDEANIGRFAGAVRQMTDRSQFIVITHSKATMERADVLYGVTMETPGISKMVSVELTGDSKSGKKETVEEAPEAVMVESDQRERRDSMVVPRGPMAQTSRASKVG